MQMFPFSAIVGQERMRRALALNAVDPRIGGVLIRGERGTAKSTAARALAALLPPIRVVAGCRFGCSLPPTSPAGDLRPSAPATLCTECRERLAAGENPLPETTRPTPFVNLPVSATEDRVVGTLDIERAIQHGQRAFEPGVLAAANRGLLYIDEVNLLDDHVVDVLLDSAAMGVNIVEREGISFSHPARFILVGTMNPEEGDLRPQLLDRFALSVDVEAVVNEDQRLEIMRRALAWEEDPEAFWNRWAAQDHSLGQAIARAQTLLPGVVAPPGMLEEIARRTAGLAIEGHRADLAIYRAARAQAALEGRSLVQPVDIDLAAELALAHRLRRDVFQTPSRPRPGWKDAGTQEFKEERKRQVRETNIYQPDENLEPSPEDPNAIAQKIQVMREQNLPTPPGATESGHTADDEQEQSLDLTPVGQYLPRRLATPLDRRERRLSGRHSPTYTRRRRGRYVRARPSPGQAEDLAFDATLRAAAPFQKARSAQRKRVAFAIRPGDYQRKVRVSHAENLIVFLVDASYSMTLDDRMDATRGAILTLLVDAYQRRDRVGLVVFNREEPTLILPPTNSVDLAQRALSSIPVGGKTPLAGGLRLAGQVVQQERRRQPGVLPLLIVVTDGAATVGTGGQDPLDEAYQVADALVDEGIRSVVINIELPGYFTGLAEALAGRLRAPVYRIPHLTAQRLLETVQQARPAADDSGLMKPWYMQEKGKGQA